jgi:hypothetical protein
MGSARLNVDRVAAMVRAAQRDDNTPPSRPRQSHCRGQSWHRALSSETRCSWPYPEIVALGSLGALRVLDSRCFRRRYLKIFGRRAPASDRLLGARPSTFCGMREGALRTWNLHEATRVERSGGVVKGPVLGRSCYEMCYRIDT